MLNTQRLLLLAWDNLGVGIIVVITTRDNHYYDEDDIKVSKQTNYKASTSQAPKSDVGAAPQKETGCPEKTNSRRKGKKNESSSLQFSLFEGL